MNPVVLYFLLLKATLTSFSGMTSLVVVHDEIDLCRRRATWRSSARRRHCRHHGYQG